MTISTNRLEAADRFISEKYLDPGVLPGVSWTVVHGGSEVHRADLGYDSDAIFRIYSMTKPITSVAMLMLMEKGYCRLGDPVSRWLPEWKNLRVYAGGSVMAMNTVGMEREMTVQDLFTHTSGLTYSWMLTHPVDAAYRKQGLGLRHLSLADTCAALAEIPLMFSPGTQWQYSLSTDVLGHLVELISGMPLDEFFQSEIFAPLGMTDTSFWVDDDRADRLVENTALPSQSPFGVPENARTFGPGELVVIDDNGPTGAYRTKPELLSGGGGLASTLSDYTKFCRMILNGGELDGTRLLGSRTVAYAGTNHLPGGASLADIGQPISSETYTEGMGFGLGFSVVIDPSLNRVIQSPGTMAWGGAASTQFWIDPAEDLTVVAMTQVMPSWSNDLRDELRQIVYSAL